MGEALLLSEPLSAPKAANSVLVVKLGEYYRDRVHIRKRVLVRLVRSGSRRTYLLVALPLDQCKQGDHLAIELYCIVAVWGGCYSTIIFYAKHLFIRDN